METKLLTNMLEQVKQIQTTCLKSTKPLDTSISTIPDDKYAKLMAPCTGPTDDPTRGDLH
jgi:hypothetical protein